MTLPGWGRKVLLLAIIPVPRYVKYEEAEFHKSAIMQDFRDNEKKMADWRPFWILLVRDFSWVILE